MLLPTPLGREQPTSRTWSRYILSHRFQCGGRHVGLKTSRRHSFAIFARPGSPVSFIQCHSHYRSHSRQIKPNRRLIISPENEEISETSAGLGYVAYSAALRSTDLFLTFGNRLLSGSIEDSTLRNYTTGLRKFSAFLAKTKVGVPLPPCSTSSELRKLITQPGVIEAFICFCFREDLVSGTAGNYIDGLKFFSTDLDGAPFFPREAVILRLLDGYQKIGKRPAPLKLAIDALFLRRLVLHVDSLNLGADNILWRTLFIIAFFGCFRPSEYLISKDKLKLLSFNRVRLLENDTFEFVLHKTKNNPSGPIQQILFAPLPGDDICPVRALHSYLSVRPTFTGNSAFFIDSTGKVVSPDRFNTMLRKILRDMKIPDSRRYSAKSFRVGAASMAYSLNVPVEDIQALGRWSSLAFLYYVRAGARAIRVCKIHKALASSKKLPL